MSIESLAHDRDCLWRDALARFGYDISDAESLVDEWSASVGIRAANGLVEGLSVKVREFWEEAARPDPLLPASHGYSMLYCSWHAQIPGVGEYRICVDPLRAGPGHPLMHVHLPNRDAERLPIEAIGVPGQWLTAVAQLVA